MWHSETSEHSYLRVSQQFTSMYSMQEKTIPNTHDICAHADKPHMTTFHKASKWLKLLRYTHGKILVPIGIPGLTIILSNLILPPFHWPWSSSYGSSKQLLSYTSLMGPIYQCVVNTVQYLLNKANNGQSFIDIDGAMILEPCLYLITFPDLPIWCYFPFP
jgi:hypothetical protein